jgi:hypothetical protein
MSSINPNIYYADNAVASFPIYRYNVDTLPSILSPIINDDGFGNYDNTNQYIRFEMGSNPTGRFSLSNPMSPSGPYALNPYNLTGDIAFNTSSIVPGDYTCQVNIVVTVAGSSQVNSVPGTVVGTANISITIDDIPSNIVYSPAGSKTDICGSIGSIVLGSMTNGPYSGSEWSIDSGAVSGITIDIATGTISYDDTVPVGTYTLGISYKSGYDVYATNNISSTATSYRTTTNYTIIITNSLPQPSGANAIITLPFIFDLSAQDVTVFGEDVTIADASFNLTTELSLSAFTSSLLYKDNESGDMDISFVSQTALKDEINSLNCTGVSVAGRDLTLASAQVGAANYSQYSKGSPGAYPPSPSSLANHFLQYVASLLFGHPQAQAPIKNDIDILTDLSNDDLGQQFVTELGNSYAVRHSILEQLINADVSSLRFDISDNDGNYHSYPFIDGDKIVFRVKMQGNLNIDAASGLSGQSGVTSSVLASLFSGITGVANVGGNMKIEERIWKVTATLRP